MEDRLDRLEELTIAYVKLWFIFFFRRFSIVRGGVLAIVIPIVYGYALIGCWIVGVDAGSVEAIVLAVALTAILILGIWTFPTWASPQSGVYLAGDASGKGLGIVLLVGTVVFAGLLIVGGSTV